MAKVWVHQSSVSICISLNPSRAASISARGPCLKASSVLATLVPQGLLSCPSRQEVSLQTAVAFNVSHLLHASGCMPYVMHAIPPACLQIDRAEVEVIVLEMLVDKKVAERRLRKHNGDLAAALQSFM